MMVGTADAGAPRSNPGAPTTDQVEESRASERATEGSGEQGPPPPPPKSWNPSGIRPGKPLELMSWPELAAVADAIEREANERIDALKAEIEKRKRFMSKDAAYQRAELKVACMSGGTFDGEIAAFFHRIEIPLKPGEKQLPGVVCRILMRSPAEARS